MIPYSFINGLQPSIIGTIQEIRLSQLTNSVMYYILKVSTKTGEKNLRINSSIFKTYFLKDLPVSSDIAFALQNDSPLNDAQKTAIVNSNIEVQATIDPNQDSSLGIGTVSITQLKVINSSSEPEVIDSQARFSSPPPEDWPIPDQELAFCPIPTPVPAGYTRIGYATFPNPIQYVTQQRTTQIDQVPAMRLPGTIKKGTGKAYESYTISYLAQGAEEIERSVKQVFEQISLSPFTTVEGGPFGTKYEDDGDIRHQAIAIRNFSVSTVPSLPNALQVEITFDPFSWQFYLSHSDLHSDFKIQHFDDAICWPLVKVWASLAGKSSYTGAPFDGRLSLYFPSEAGHDYVNYLYSSNSREVTPDTFALESFKEILQNKSPEGANLISRNIKQIDDPNTPSKIYLLKVASKEIFESFKNSSFFVGLIDWSKLVPNNKVDHTGKLISTSALVDPTTVTKSISGQVFSSTDIADDRIKDTYLERYTDIHLPSTPGLSLDDKIRDYLTLGGYGADAITQAIDNPQTLFGIVLWSPEINDNLRNIVEENYKRAATHEDLIIGDYGSKGNISELANSLAGRAYYDYIDRDLPVLESGPGAPHNDIVIENVGGSRAHTLATLSQRGDPLPIHQYMGGMDATFIVQGKCFGLDAKRRLEDIKDAFDRLALMKRSKKLSMDLDQAKKGTQANASFLFIDNEIFRLMGVNFVMPVTLQFETLDQQPGVWNFTISFIEYSPELKKAEQIRFLPTTWQELGKIHDYGWNYGAGGDFGSGSNPIMEKAIEYFGLQAELAKEEVYPDMRLPTRSELKYWIDAIQKGAKLWAKHKKVDPALLTPSQAKIVSLVQNQYFPDHANTIVKYFNPAQVNFIANEPGSFVEPDFYVWYHHEETFGSIFDGLSEHLMGRGPQLRAGSNNKFHRKKDAFTAEGRATGTEDPSKSPVGPYREHDTLAGVSAEYDASYFSANGSKYNLEEQAKKTFESLYPPKRAQMWKDKLAEAEKDLIDDQRGWWKLILSKYTTSTFREDSNRMELSEAQKATMARVYVYTSTTTAPNIDPILEGAIPPFSQVQQDLWKYFTLDWKQKMLAEIAGFLPTATLTSDALRGFWHNASFYATNPHELLPPLDSEVANPGIPDFSYTAKVLAGTNKVPDDMTIKDIEDSIRVNLQKSNSHIQDIIKKQASFALGIGLTNDMKMPGPLQHSRTLPWIIRVGLINANYRRVKSLPRNHNYPKDYSVTGHHAITANWDYVDALAIQYNMDPHILRAVFLKRDGFGHYDVQGSKEEGKGDFNFSPDLDYQQSIDLFAQTYKYYSQFTQNIPSLTLLCINLKYTSNGERYLDAKGEIKAEVLENISNSAKRIASNRLSDEAATEISSILNQYGMVSNTIDQYFSTYISLNRQYGAYGPDIPDSIRDPYFHGFNILNLMDTKTNKEIINSKFSPTNRLSGTGVDLSRGDGSGLLGAVDPYAKLYQKYDKNHGSAELEDALARKMLSTIQPHTDDALYGSLVDFRNHAPIGKFIGAFPSFQILLINEGTFWNGGSKKLWDQFYTRTGVASIEVHRSRLQPASTASITFSNMFHNITAYSLMEAIAHKQAVELHEELGRRITTYPSVVGMVGPIWQMMVLKNVPEEVRKIWQNNQLKRLALTAGTRLQIRMGYGSNAARLPVVFIGHIVDAPVSDGFVTLTAVSDGHQLEKLVNTKIVKSGSAFAFQDGGAFGMGSDPSQIVKHALIAATWKDNITGGRFRDHSAGVANFGETIFQGGLRFSAEIEFNIYAARRTSIEQGISELQDYNLWNGIVNWNNEKNLFSVSVQEPTPWKVMEVCRRACADFVAAAEPFALRSSVFFGKWWWPYHFTYDQSILRFALSNNVLSSKLIENARAEQVATAPGKIKSTQPTKGSITKNEYLASELPEGLLVEAKKINTSAEVGYGRKIIEGRWIVYYNDGAGETFDLVGNRWINDPTVRINATAESRAAYEASIAKTGDDRAGVYQEPFSGQIKKAQPSTALERRLNEVKYLSYADHLKDVATLQLYLRWKPYMQAYIAHSAINLLENNIRADGSRVYTDAIGMHQYNGWISGTSVSRTNVFSLDTDIAASDRKTMMVDTGILLTGLQAGSDAIAGGITTALKVPFMGADPLGLNEYIEQSPTTPAIENSVVTALIDQVKEMYQGWFMIQGMSTVKPRDLFLFTDHITDLKGPLFVKDVIHKMDAQSGFITLVSPDCVVIPHESIIGKQMISSLSVGILQRFGGFYMMKATTAFLSQMFKNKYIYKRSGLSENFRAYKKIQGINIQGLNQLGLSREDAMREIDTALQELQARQQTLLQRSELVVNKGTSVTPLTPEEILERDKNVAKIKKLSELKDTIAKKSSPVDLARALSELETTLDLPTGRFDKLTKAKVFQLASIQEKQALFEAALEKELQEMRQLASKGKIGVFDKFSPGEIEKAIQNFADERRALFADSLADEIEEILKFSDDPDILENRRLVNRLKELKTLQSNGALDELAEEEMDDLVKAIRSRVQAGAIIEAEIPDATIRRLFKWERVVFVDAQRMNPFRAAWKSITDSPQSVVNGILGYGRGFAQDMAEKKAVTRLAKQYNIKTFLQPRAWVQVQIQLKEIEKEFFTLDGIKDERIRLATKSLDPVTDAEKIAKLTADIQKEFDTGTDIASQAKVIQRIRMAENLLDTAKGSVAGLRLLKYMGPQAVISLAVDASIMILGESLIEGHNARLRARQCAKIFPLMSGKIPFVAGIRGHQGAVIGDQPSWVDELISNLHGVKTKSGDGILSDAGINAMAVLASFGGVELPEWGETEVDSAYLKIYRGE